MEKDDKDIILRLILRSVYLKGQADANKKITDLAWEDEIISDIKKAMRLSGNRKNGGR